MKKTLPVAFGVLTGCYIVAEYFIPHHAVRTVSSHVLEWGGIVAASAFVIGGINLVQVTWPKIRRREADWQYKVVLLASAAIMTIVGLPWGSLLPSRSSGQVAWVNFDADAQARGKALIDLDAPSDVVISIAGVTRIGAKVRIEVDAGPASPLPLVFRPASLHIKATRRVVGYDAYDVTIAANPGDVIAVQADPVMLWGANGRFRTWIYDHVFAPCNATMFALLAFFVASAAFRAFRARNVESGLLLGSAIIILLARAPIGRAISTSLPDLAQWILDIPSNGSRRAIIMGAAVGAIATGLRVILGLERSHLGGDS